MSVEVVFSARDEPEVTVLCGSIPAVGSVVHLLDDDGNTLLSGVVGVAEVCFVGKRLVGARVSLTAHLGGSAESFGPNWNDLLRTHMAQFGESGPVLKGEKHKVVATPRSGPDWDRLVDEAVRRW